MKQVFFGLVAALALTSVVQAQCSSGGYGYRPAPSYGYGYGRPVGHCNDYCPPVHRPGFVTPAPIGPGFVPGGVPGGVAPGGVVPGGVAPGGVPVVDGPNGNQPLLECHLALRNDGEHAQKVFLQYRTVAGGRWTWMGQPGTEQAFEVTIPAGKTVAITHGGRKITASRIRLWTEGWNEFRGQDFWLVKDRDENGHRRYFAPQIATQTVVLGNGGQPGIPVNNGPVVNGPTNPGPNTPTVVAPIEGGQVPPTANPPVIPPTTTQVVPPTQDPPVVPPTTAPVVPPTTPPVVPPTTTPTPLSGVGQSTTPPVTTPPAQTPPATTPPSNNQGDDNIIIDPDRRPRQMGVLEDE